MFGWPSAVNPLALRKQLLVAESELNREQALAEWHHLTRGLRGFVGPLKSVSSMASTVAKLFLSAFRSQKCARVGTKRSWLQTILDNAGLFTSLWVAFRSRSNDESAQ
jgi:hypothetical protein